MHRPADDISDGYGDPLAPLARDIARSMTEAGPTVHHCAQHDPMYRLGGVCLLAVPAESRSGHGGIAVSWTVQNLAGWTGTGAAPTPVPSRP